MTLVHSKALDETVKVDRVIDYIQGKKGGPTVVFFGGVHGNETAGVFALKEVFKEIRDKKIPINGEVYAISGNLGALENRQRFQHEDLNIIWLQERIDRIVHSKQIKHNEEEYRKKKLLQNQVSNVFTEESFEVKRKKKDGKIL